LFLGFILLSVSCPVTLRPSPRKFGSDRAKPFCRGSEREACLLLLGSRVVVVRYYPFTICTRRKLELQPAEITWDDNPITNLFPAERGRQIGEELTPGTAFRRCGSNANVCYRPARCALRVVARASGAFNIQSPAGNVQGITMTHCARFAEPFRSEPSSVGIGSDTTGSVSLNAKPRFA
jgi:hypothetical protein